MTKLHSRVKYSFGKNWDTCLSDSVTYKIKHQLQLEFLSIVQNFDLLMKTSEEIFNLVLAVKFTYFKYWIKWKLNFISWFVLSIENNQNKILKNTNFGI